MNNTINKLLACMLVITLTFTNLILLGTYATNSYAVTNELEQQETVIKDAVEFDAYFLDGDNKVHSKVADINQTDLKLYVSIEVSSGYLRNTIIDMQDANFSIKNVSDTYEKIFKIENNIITLNEISAGDKYIFELPIEINITDKINVDNFSKENNAKINGILVTAETGITGNPKNIEIQNTIKVKLDLHGEATPVLNKGITKYAEYNTAEKSGVVLQTVLQTGLYNNNLPINTTILELSVPTLNNAKPTKINVTANSLEATVGDETGNSFTDGNWKYYENDEKIRITVGNVRNENNEANWDKEGLDEYVVTYVYEGQTVPEDKNITIKANLSIEAFNDVDTIVTAVDENATILEEQVGNIATFKMESTDTLSKGYMYHSPATEIEYQTKWTANLGYIDIIDNIKMSTEADILKNEDSNIAVSGCTYYKSTVISKQNFTKILGDEESSFIQIWNPNTSSNTPIITIDKNTAVNEENNIVVNYEAGIDNIYILTSQPVAEGKLEILHNKGLKAESLYPKYDKTSILSLTKLGTKLNGVAINGGNVLAGGEDLTKDIILQEPQTKIVSSLDKTNLSTVVTNENVNLKLVLKSNDITTDLYENPVIELVLPTYIETMTINTIDLLHEEELGEPVATPITNEEGKSVLRIEIPGVQTKYHENKSTEGATLAINADIKVKSLTPSLTDKIQIYVTNNKAVTYENEQNGKGYQELPINFVAPIGMVTVNSISGYNGDEKVTSISAQEQLGEISINSLAKTAKVDLNIINNYEETCKDINILGRLPSEGNKNINGTDLGSNLTLKLVSAITPVSEIAAENVTIYYSDNVEASNDLTVAENGWTTSTENLANVKSYLIVLNNYEMPKGDALEFTYNVEIPANLKHNQTSYTMYTVYFTKDSGAQESNTSAKVGLSTMEGPEISVNLKSNVENGQIVQEGDAITYTVEVQNTGEIEAKNIKVVSAVPEGTIYAERKIENVNVYGPPEYILHPEIENYEAIIESIKPGDTKTVEYTVQVASVGQEEKTIFAQATVTVLDLEDIYTTNTIENKAQKGFVKITIENKSQMVLEDNIYKIIAKIENVNDEEKTNVKITYKIPEGMEYQAAKAHLGQEEQASKLQFDENTNTLTYNLGTLAAYNYEILYVDVKIKPLTENETEKQIVNIIEASCDQTTNTLKSNQLIYTLAKAKLEVKQISDIASGNISSGDVLTYNIEVSNVGKGVATNVKVTDYIPDGLKYLSTTYTIGDYTNTVNIGSETATITLDINPGQTVYVQIKTVAEQLEAGQQTKEVTNVVKVSADNIEEIEANKIVHIINAKGNSQGGNNQENNNNTYKITGSVWKDDNENGSREDNEVTLNGITVMLINATTASKVSEVITDASGKYEFINLEPGRYMVAFMYNNQEYMVTMYQVESVNESRNSDAIDNAIVVDGNIFTGAITNNINLTSSNRYNIDLGLVLRNRFDLSLEKTISNITVKTTAGTQNYTYDEGEKLAKIDIAPKRIEGANVVIEYKITVTNNGTIPGFVNKIVDYMPKELKFSSELNQNWYEAEDGNIYNSSIADTLLQPGEAKEITLVLTKTMTGENTGLVHNTAEIYEAYNDLGIADINSTPKNKAQNENDMSMADVLLTVNTGEPAMYTILTIAMLALFAGGAYLINKKVLKK